MGIVFCRRRPSVWLESLSDTERRVAAVSAVSPLFLTQGWLCAPGTSLIVPAGVLHPQWEDAKELLPLGEPCPPAPQVGTQGPCGPLRAWRSPGASPYLPHKVKVF